MKALLIVLLAVTLLGGVVYAQNEVSVSTDKSQPAAEATQIPVAVVLDKQIFEADLIPQTEGISDAEKQDYRRGMITSLIFGTLVEDFAKGLTIDPSEADVAAFITKVKTEQESNRQEFASRKTELEASLKAEGLDEATKKGYEEQLSQVDAILGQLDSVNTAEIDPSVVKEFIRSWKINQALYAKYGGRVIFQQSGPEPLDAYKAFLKEAETKGSFKISDPALQTLFWEYFVNEGMHTFLPEEEAKKAMTTPWWTE